MSWGGGCKVHEKEGNAVEKSTRRKMNQEGELNKEKKKKRENWQPRQRHDAIPSLDVRSQQAIA